MQALLWDVLLEEGLVGGVLRSVEASEDMVLQVTEAFAIVKRNVVRLVGGTTPVVLSSLALT